MGQRDGRHKKEGNMDFAKDPKTRSEAFCFFSLVREILMFECRRHEWQEVVQLLLQLASKDGTGAVKQQFHAHCCRASRIK